MMRIELGGDIYKGETIGEFSEKILVLATRFLTSSVLPFPIAVNTSIRFVFAQKLSWILRDERQMCMSQFLVNISWSLETQDHTIYSLLIEL